MSLDDLLKLIQSSLSVLLYSLLILKCKKFIVHFYLIQKALNVTGYSKSARFMCLIRTIHKAIDCYIFFEGVPKRIYLHRSMYVAMKIYLTHIFFNLLPLVGASVIGTAQRPVLLIDVINNRTISYITGIHPFIVSIR